MYFTSVHPIKADPSCMYSKRASFLIGEDSYIIILQTCVSPYLNEAHPYYTSHLCITFPYSGRLSYISHLYILPNFIEAHPYIYFRPMNHLSLLRQTPLHAVYHLSSLKQTPIFHTYAYFLILK